MRMFLGPFRFLIPKSKTVEPWRIVHQLYDFYTQKTMAETTQVEGKPLKGQSSVLETLAVQTRDKLEVRDNALHAMMGAQDTLPMLLCNTLFCLSRHPEVWARLREEVSSASPDPLTIDEVRKYKLLRNILSECRWPNLTRDFFGH